MFGDAAYADVPFASLSTVSLYVAACIHTDVQIKYTCTLGIALVYNATASIEVCPCSTSSGVC